jgi:hypothetical protein
MKQFSTSTSQSSAKGSFTTLDSLTTFSDALAFLCDEITQLRAELDDVRSHTGAAPKAASKPKAAVKSKSPLRKATTRR